MRVADTIVEILKTEGVPFVAGFPGDDLLPLWDALYECGDIPLIVTGMNRRRCSWPTDTPAVPETGCCYRDQWTGRTNALTAILNAFTDSVPLVVLFGHTSLKFLGKGRFRKLPIWISSRPWPSGLRHSKR